MQKSLILFATVLLVFCHAAKMSKEVTQQVTVPVLDVSTPTKTSKPAVPAKVITVNKENVKTVEMTSVPAKVITVNKENVKTVEMTSVSQLANVNTSDMKRKTRAVPFSDSSHTKSQITEKSNLINVLQTRPAMVHKLSSHRAMRSVPAVEPTKTLTDVAVKSSESSTTSATTIDPCDLLCTKFEFEPICASNSLCVHEFPNQCILDTYNCKHPSKKFKATKTESCQIAGLNKCEEAEMI